MKKKIKKSLLEVVVVIIVSIILGNTLNFKGEDLNTKIQYSLAIFMNLAPIIYFFIKFKVAKKRPIFFIGFIFYYLIILPIWTKVAFGNGIIDDLSNHPIENLTSLYIIIGLNMILLIVSQIFIIKYVLIDILIGQRKAKSSDIWIVFLVYITLGITFGFVYVLVLHNDPTAIHGIVFKDLSGLDIYFQSIYFSFITLTSVGYGEIIPTSFVAQIFVILESVIGVLLLSFSLGVVFSTNLNVAEEEEKKSKKKVREKLSKDEIYKVLKKELMNDFEETLDKHIEKYVYEKNKDNKKNEN